MRFLHRLRPKFKLWQLMSLMTVFCILFGRYTSSSLQQRKSVELLSEMGAEVEYASSDVPILSNLLARVLGDDFAYSVYDVKLHHNTTNDDVELLRAFQNLQSLTVRGTTLDDDGLTTIGKLTTLDSLSLQTPCLNGDNAKQLRSLRNLRSLTLTFCPLDGHPEILEILHAFPKLEILSLENNNLDSHGVAHLREAHQLRVLSLSSNSIKDDDLALLVDLKKLEHLALSDTRISNDGLEEVAKLSSLKILRLSDTDVTAGFDHLAHLGNLQALVVFDCELTDEGLQQIADLKTLTNVLLSNYAVDENDVLWLRKQLPAAVISTR